MGSNKDVGALRRHDASKQVRQLHLQVPKFSSSKSSIYRSLGSSCNHSGCECSIADSTLQAVSLVRLKAAQTTTTLPALPCLTPLHKTTP